MKIINTIIAKDLELMIEELGFEFDDQYNHEEKYTKVYVLDDLRLNITSNQRGELLKCELDIDMINSIPIHDFEALIIMITGYKKLLKADRSKNISAELLEKMQQDFLTHVAAVASLFISLILLIKIFLIDG